MPADGRSLPSTTVLTFDEPSDAAEFLLGNPHLETDPGDLANTLRPDVDRTPTPPGGVLGGELSARDAAASSEHTRSVSLMMIEPGPRKVTTSLFSVVNDAFEELRIVLRTAPAVYIESSDMSDPRSS